MSARKMSRDVNHFTSFFTTHYGSGSGSDSGSGQEEEEHEEQQSSVDPVREAAEPESAVDGAGVDDDDTDPRVGDDFSDDGAPAQLLSPKEFHKTLLGLSPDQIRIPRRNQGSVDPVIQEKLERLNYTKETQALDMKHEIQKRKDFRNPSIYEKLIDHCNIKEFGSNFPSEVFDPDGFAPSSYYEELSKAQKQLMDAFAEAKAKADSHPKVEIIHATAKKPASLPSTSSSSSSGSSDPNRRKRTKWDEGPAVKKA